MKIVACAWLSLLGLAACSSESTNGSGGTGGTTTTTTTTASYGGLARRIGNPRAARAVGGALGRNPLALFIPCHRIIAGDGLAISEEARQHLANAATFSSTAPGGDTVIARDGQHIGDVLLFQPGAQRPVIPVGLVGGHHSASATPARWFTTRASTKRRSERRFM